MAARDVGTRGQGGILWQIRFPYLNLGFSSIIIGFMVNLERGEGTWGLVGRRRNEWQPGPLESGGRGHILADTFSLFQSGGRGGGGRL